MIKLITSAFEEMGIEAALTNDGYEALGRILNENFDGLITSYQTPTIDGINLTKIIRATDLIPSDFNIILITSDNDIDEFDGLNRLFRKKFTLRENIKDYLELFYAD
jgi:CheY-like chemotaxis protein